MIEFESIWDELLARKLTRREWVRKRIVPEASCAVYGAVLWPDARISLLLECSAESVPARRERPQAAGFSIEIEDLENGDRRLCLILNDPAWRTLFATLCGDLVKAVAEEPNSRTAVQSFLTKLGSWQDFMLRHGPGGLTKPERIGLVAELLTLETWLLERCDGIEVVEAWSGPDHRAHDFMFGTRKLEVKGTTMRPARSFRASNLVQLDDSGLDDLFLCHVTMFEPSRLGRTLPDIVQDLKDRLSSDNPSATDRFEEKLLLAGYLDAQADLYRDETYSVDEFRLFRVTDSFPRLVPSSVPPGITDAEYTVELAALDEWSVSGEEMIGTMLGMTAYE